MLKPTESHEFAYAFREYLRQWPGLILFLLIPIVVIVKGFERGSLELVAAGIIVLGLAYFPLSSVLITMASPARVRVTAEGLTMRNFFGRRSKVAWNDITERREFRGAGTIYGGHDAETLWLVVRDRRLPIILDESIPRFEELRVLIRSNTPNIATTDDTRSWWRKVFSAI